MEYEIGKVYQYSSGWSRKQQRCTYQLVIILDSIDNYYLIGDLNTGAKRTIKGGTLRRARGTRIVYVSNLNILQTRYYKEFIDQINQDTTELGGSMKKPLKVNIKNKIEIIDPVDLAPGECIEVDGQYYIAITDSKTEEKTMLCLNNFTYGSVLDVGIRRNIQITVSE